MPKYQNLEAHLIDAIIRGASDEVNAITSIIVTPQSWQLNPGQRDFDMVTQRTGQPFDPALREGLFLALAQHLCSVNLDPERVTLFLNLLNHHLALPTQAPFVIQALITFHDRLKKQPTPAQSSVFAATPFGKAAASPIPGWILKLESIILNQPLAGVEAFKAYCIQQRVSLSAVTAMLKENIPQLNPGHDNYQACLRQVLSGERKTNLVAVFLGDDLFNVDDANKRIQDSNFYQLCDDHPAVAALSPNLIYDYFKSALNPNNDVSLATSRLKCLKQAGFDVLPFVDQLSRDGSFKDITDAVSKVVLDEFKISITKAGVSIWTDEAVIGQIIRLLRNEPEGSTAKLKVLLDKLSSEQRLNLTITDAVMADMMRWPSQIENRRLVLSNFHDQYASCPDFASRVQYYIMCQFVGYPEDPLALLPEAGKRVAADVLARFIDTPYYVAAVSCLYGLEWLTDEEVMTALNQMVREQQFLSGLKNNTVLARSVQQLRTLFGDDPDGRKAISLNFKAVEGRCTAAQAWIKALGDYLAYYYKYDINNKGKAGFDKTIDQMSRYCGVVATRLEGGIDPRSTSFKAYLNDIFNLLAALNKSENLDGLLSANHKEAGWAFISLVFHEEHKFKSMVSDFHKKYPEFFVALHPVDLVTVLDHGSGKIDISKLVSALLRSPRLQLDLNDKTAFRALMLFSFCGYDNNFADSLSSYLDSFIRWFIKAESINPYLERVDLIGLAEETKLSQLPFVDDRLLRVLPQVAKEKSKLDGVKSTIWTYFKNNLDALLKPLHEKMILGEPCPFLNVIRFDRNKEALIDTPEMNIIYEKIRAVVASEALIATLKRRLAQQPSPRDAVLLLAFSPDMANSEFNELAYKHLLNTDFSRDESQKIAFCDALKLLSKEDFKCLKERLVNLVLLESVQSDHESRLKVKSLLEAKKEGDNPFLMVLRTRRGHYDRQNTKSYQQVVKRCLSQVSLLEKAGKAVMYPINSSFDEKVKTVNQRRVIAEMDNENPEGPHTL